MSKTPRTFINEPGGDALSGVFSQGANMTEYRLVMIGIGSTGAYPDLDAASGRLKDMYGGSGGAPFPTAKYDPDAWAIEQWDEGEDEPTTVWRVELNGDTVVV